MLKTDKNFRHQTRATVVLSHSSTVEQEEHFNLFSIVFKGRFGVFETARVSLQRPIRGSEILTEHLFNHTPRAANRTDGVGNGDWFRIGCFVVDINNF